MHEALECYSLFNSHSSSVFRVKEYVSLVILPACVVQVYGNSIRNAYFCNIISRSSSLKVLNFTVSGAALQLQ